MCSYCSSFFEEHPEPPIPAPTNVLINLETGTIAIENSNQKREQK